MQRLSSLPAGLPGLVLAFWALVSQVALGAIVLPGDLQAQQQAIARLDTASVLCAAGQPPNHPRPVPRHHTADAALCPLQVAQATAGLILVDAPAVPPPASPQIGRLVSTASARGPPASRCILPLPRGPPAFA